MLILFGLRPAIETGRWCFMVSCFYAGGSQRHGHVHVRSDGALFN